MEKLNNLLYGHSSQSMMAHPIPAPVSPGAPLAPTTHTPSLPLSLLGLSLPALNDRLRYLLLLPIQHP